MTKAYKIQNNIAPPTMKTILERKSIPYLTIQEFVTQKQNSELWPGILK